MYPFCRFSSWGSLVRVVGLGVSSLPFMLLLLVVVVAASIVVGCVLVVPFLVFLFFSHLCSCCVG